MRTLVLPVAGKSERYPGVRPKYILLHPYGPKMLTESIRGIRPEWFDKILIIGLREHENEYKHMDMLVAEIKKEYAVENVEYVLLNSSKSQAETVYKGLKKARVHDGGIAVRDCDSYFRAMDDKSVFDHNFVVTGKLSEMEKVNAGNKSYVIAGKKKTITNIVEKQVISDEFCCGMYYFHCVGDFFKTFEKIQDVPYISHIIYHMILNGHTFFIEPSEEYVDWGTLDDWLDYCSDFKTLFIDLDGTLLEASARDFGKVRWGQSKPIQENIDYVNKLYDEGKVVVVITTGRTPDWKTKTEQELHEKGIKYHILLCGLPHTKRVLINDYGKTIPYPSATAISMPSNSKRLGDLLDGC